MHRTTELAANADLRTTGTLLGIWAHPDDEAYLSAGLMHAVAARGGRVVCVTATCGERGTDDPGRWPPYKLAAHRTDELRAALAALDVHEMHVLGLPDGGCDTIDPGPPTDFISALMDEIRPDLVVTFGPDGITGHPDHVAVSGWTTEAWRRRAGASDLRYATMTPSFVERHASLHRRIRLFPPGHPHPSMATDDVVTVRLENDERRAKRAALAAHASQTDELVRAMGEDVFAGWWDVESFRRPRAAEVSAKAS